MRISSAPPKALMSKCKISCWHKPLMNIASRLRQLMKSGNEEKSPDYYKEQSEEGADIAIKSKG